MQKERGWSLPPNSAIFMGPVEAMLLGIGGVSSSVWRSSLSGFIRPSVIANGASSLPVSSTPLAGQWVSTEISDAPAIVRRGSVRPTILLRLLGLGARCGERDLIAPLWGLSAGGEWIRTFSSAMPRRQRGRLHSAASQEFWTDRLSARRYDPSSVGLGKINREVSAARGATRPSKPLPVSCGTESSNPFPSCGESANWAGDPTLFGVGTEAIGRHKKEAITGIHRFTVLAY